LNQPVIILGIESSCDETAAAVCIGDKILANVVAGQKVHESYGGIVPELASRAHQQNIIPVVDQALKQANVSKNDLSAIAFTSGPGLMGALLVGTSFAKAFALGLNIPLIEVNHMQAHVLAHFAKRDGHNDSSPVFPFICLTVSGGHTQIIVVKSHFEMDLIGQTLDDAAGEAFDKIAKVLGLTYPGGPLIDRLAAVGNPKAYKFPHPQVPGYNFSFSGLKTAVMNFINNKLQSDPQFIEKHINDLAASVQNTIIEILMERLRQVVNDTGISTVAIAGGVAANSGLRNALYNEKDWQVFIPPFDFCTDNAAMIAVCGYFKYLKGDFTDQMISPEPRFSGL
jgi:N6-L-threonylcarbamoyladenine synthase